MIYFGNEEKNAPMFFSELRTIIVLLLCHNNGFSVGNVIIVDNK